MKKTLNFSQNISVAYKEQNMCALRAFPESTNRCCKSCTQPSRRQQGCAGHHAHLLCRCALGGSCSIALTIPVIQLYFFQPFTQCTACSSPSSSPSSLFLMLGSDDLISLSNLKVSVICWGIQQQGAAKPKPSMKTRAFCSALCPSKSNAPARPAASAVLWGEHQP